MKFTSFNFSKENQFLDSSFDFYSEFSESRLIKANQSLLDSVQNFSHFTYTEYSLIDEIPSVFYKGQFVKIKGVLYVVFRPRGFPVSLFNVFIKDLISKSISSYSYQSFNYWQQDIFKTSIKDKSFALQKLYDGLNRFGLTSGRKNASSLIPPSEHVLFTALTSREVLSSSNILSFTRPSKNRFASLPFDAPQMVNRRFKI